MVATTRHHLCPVVPDVRFGSLADILRCGNDVRFAPNSGHVQCNSACPLSANSGHSHIRLTQLGTSSVDPIGNSISKMEP